VNPVKLPPNVAGFVVNEIETNTWVYHAPGASDALVVDPGGDLGGVRAYLRASSLAVRYIVVTHAHYDHIMSVEDLQRETGAPVVIGEADRDRFLNNMLNFSVPAGAGPAVSGAFPEAVLCPARDGDTLALGAERVRVLAAPGHTPGGICLYIEESSGRRLMFTGDTLFCGDCGRTDFPGGDARAMRNTLARLASLPDDTLFFPGHGDPCTIGEDRTHNECLR
jgi:hydroxyacylglutathione hydrolase